jgi:predicted PurR-regulated permease PerM
VNRRTADRFLTRSHIFTIVFFGVFLFLLYQIIRLLAPFSGALLWAGVIALALRPLHRKVEQLLQGRQALAATIMTIIALLMVIGPAISLLAVLVSQTIDLYQWAATGIRTGAAQELWDRAASLVENTLLDQPMLAGLDIRDMLIKGLSQFSSSLASQVGTVLRNTLLLVIDLFIMLIALYFFFRNGERYYAMSLDLVPFSAKQKEHIAKKLYDTFTAVINGVFLIALGQGIMTGIGFALFQVPFPVFWGFCAAVLALLPVGGAALVWLPGAAFLLLTRSTSSGLLLAAWGLFLVSLPDNFVKPLIIGKKAKLPTFFLFLGILGGLQVYGFLGILFGPLVVTLATAFVQIYRDEFAGNGHSHEQAPDAGAAGSHS